MAEQKNWETPEALPKMVDMDSESSDLGFNRRIGLGLILSIGANVLLLQGAGVMKNKMNDMPRSVGHITMTFASPKPSPSPVTTPAPTPTPAASVEPAPKPRKLVEPTPTPKPKPIERKVEPRPIPKPRPSAVTPTPTPAPTKVDKVETKTADISPAIAMTPHNVEVKQNNKPALGKVAASAEKVFAAVPRSSSAAAATNFTVDQKDVAPTPHISDLPRPTLAGAISAAINSAASAKVQQNSTPGVESAIASHANVSATIRAGKVIPLSGQNAVMTSNNPTAAPSFSMSPGGSIAPGTPLAHQGSGPRSTNTNPNMSSGAAQTVLANGGGQMGLVSGTNPRSETGPHGGSKLGRLLGPNTMSSGGDKLRGAGNGGQPGPAGLDGGSVDGGGNGPSFQPGKLKGGSPAGFGSSGNGSDAKHVEGAHVIDTPTGKTPPGAPVHQPPVTDTPDGGGYGSAVNAQFSTPSSDAIVTPDSLRSTPYNVTVTVRVTLEASGSVRVEITNGSGHAALDAQVKAVCSRIKFKPAMQDGKAVNESHTFNFNLTNSGG